jgi:putative spermidine/putrescine transport system ATP-binding protein
VTHDQEEALSVADRVGVMNAGRLDQIAAPDELYARPATRFVAEFVGLNNKLTGDVAGDEVTVLGCRVPTVEGSLASGRGTALVRPEAVTVEPADDGNASVLAVSFLGPISRLTARLDDGQEVMAQLPSSLAMRLAPDTRVRLGVEPSPVLVVSG